MQILVLDRVSDRNDLSIGLIEKCPHIDLPLAAAAHDRDIDFLARRNEFGPAQHVARNQAGTGDNGGGCGQELATAHRVIWTQRFFDTRIHMLKGEKRLGLKGRTQANSRRPFGEQTLGLEFQIPQMAQTNSMGKGT